MDVEKRSLTGWLKNTMLMAWVLISTILYGTLCILLTPINKRISKFCAIAWNTQLLMMAGVKVTVQGARKIDPNKRYVFVANHQSYIDIPVLYKALNCRLSFIAKKELFGIPLFGWALYMDGHIWIDRGNARKAHASIIKAVDRLKKNNVSLILFPEGTRSVDGVIGQLKQGSFLLVQQAGVEVVPIAIHDTYRLMPKHSCWLNKGTVHVTIGDPIAIDPSMSKADIAEKVRGVLVAALEGGKGQPPRVG
jgi:1-acyl-sn-glycerol-3-phosphate acyltransferase